MTALIINRGAHITKPTPRDRRQLLPLEKKVPFNGANEPALTNT
jgi:hypothetical protein